jgi:phosphoglycerol transferase MdoB-like AlkP superfamily enzyme
VISEKYKGKFMQEKDAHKVVAYSDYAMQTFFEKAKKQQWFKNTIFIITADHTCGTRYQKKYKNKIGRYAIPLILFKGDGSLVGENNTIVQQIDIMPTVLDLLNYNKGFFAFGKSMLTSESWALSYLENKYYFISENGFLINKGEEYQLFKDWDLTKKLEVKEEDVRKLKAIKQQYNKAMIENKLLYEN